MNLKDLKSGLQAAYYYAQKKILKMQNNDFLSLQGHVSSLGPGSTVRGKGKNVYM